MSRSGHHGPDAEQAVQRQLDDAFSELRERDLALEESRGASFRARLLDDFDAMQRRRRLSLFAFAEAFRWPALSRPLAPAGVLSALCAVGFIAGAATSSNVDDEIADALDQSFAYSMENEW